MSLRGKAAIVGFGELPTRRVYPGRSTNSLLAEAAKIAIADAGLRKEQIDGLITRAAEVDVMQFAEYIGLRPVFCNGAVGKYSSKLRPLMSILPLPGVMRMRATEVLRRPVAMNSSVVAISYSNYFNETACGCCAAWGCDSPR